MEKTAKKAQHTPGPWQAKQHGVPYNGKSPVYWSIEIANGLGKGLTICDSLESETSNDDEANARLIAAAPELLEALKFVLDEYISAMSSEFDFPGSPWLSRAKGKDTALIMGETAINKALGN